MVSDELSMLYPHIEEDNDDIDDADKDYDVSSKSDDNNNPDDKEDDISPPVNPLSSTTGELPWKKNHFEYLLKVPRASRCTNVNGLDMQEHQGVVTRAKVKQLKSHKDQIEQEKFQGLNFDVNFDVQDFMGIKF
ncbi:hypothetical protein M9H77_14213 [Catharanthus roseus]|uniref:Uncharacterized protein n=1 Tax=Catharanthus roseus TaxID=4058 RepID=A0ACC0BMD9_CATRO|nr:hypothetical protein M9H77_14213 [Catharanthus roseus]